MRRNFLRVLGLGGLTASAGFAGWLRPEQLLAAESSDAAFDARTLDDALEGIGATSAIESELIQLKAPEIAENGAIVPVEVASQIPGTQAIYIIADKNPQPLAAMFEFVDGIEPFIATRIKMGESSKVRVIAKAGGKFYVTAREVKVTIGGCGG